MSLISDIRAVLRQIKDDDLAERLIIPLVMRAVGKTGGRPSVGASESRSTVEGLAPDERKIALSERKKGVSDEQGGFQAQTDTPLYPPDLVLSGSSGSSGSGSGSPDLFEASSTRVLSKICDAESQEFCDWYALYPKKRSRRDAWKAWGQVAQHRPPFAQLRSALDWQRSSDEWIREGGAFIPFPATYLRGHRWADERTAASAAGLSDRERRGIANTQAWLAGGVR